MTYYDFFPYDFKPYATVCTHEINTVLFKSVHMPLAVHLFYSNMALYFTLIWMYNTLCTYYVAIFFTLEHKNFRKKVKIVTEVYLRFF